MLLPWLPGDVMPDMAVLACVALVEPVDLFRGYYTVIVINILLHVKRYKSNFNVLVFKFWVGAGLR